jgi:hypothetical protein
MNRGVDAVRRYLALARPAGSVRGAGRGGREYIVQNLSRSELRVPGTLRALASGIGLWKSRGEVPSCDS